MDLTGSLVDTNVRIFPSEKLQNFIKTLPINRATPYNIAKLAKGEDFIPQINKETVLKPADYQLNTKDIETVNKIKDIVKSQSANEDSTVKEEQSEKETSESSDDQKDDSDTEVSEKSNVENEDPNDKKDNVKNNDEKMELISKEEIQNDKSDVKKKLEVHTTKPYLVTTDIDWLYKYLKEKRSKGDKDVPFLHVLLEGVDVVMPSNEIIKRNPILEERCVKLRAQQEARVYKKMTKSVDNVRMRFPEDSISYQLKQVNRQLIGIGQFVLSIFAGFLFGFQGLEWIIGGLELGFRLLLGVMCASIIAIAEIYFLAKKLNEELTVPETSQLGGPAKFVNPPTCHGRAIEDYTKEHKD